MTKVSLELRILSGLHATAVAPWEDAGEKMSFGHGFDNDVILRDAVFEHAELIRLPNGFELVIDDQLFPVSESQVIRVESLAWVIQPKHASWPTKWHDAPRLPLSSIPPSQESETDKMLVPSTGAQALEQFNSQRKEDTQEVMLESPLVNLSISKPSPWKRYVGWSLALVFAGCLLIAMPWIQTGQSGTPLSQLALKPTPPTHNEVSLHALEQILEKSAWSSQVRIAQGSNGTFRLLGVVDTMDDVDQIILLLSSKTRRIEPQVLTQIEFEQRVNNLHSKLPEGIRASAQAGGRILLQANKFQHAELKPVRQMLLTEIPEALEIDISTTGERIPVQTAKAGDWSLPAIASVHSGENAYVMLANGRKVLPGGSLAKLTLSSIEDDTLVLQAPNGQLFRVNR